ncbi:hydroxysqualene dehydroxylase HpnE [Allobranchiibius huperziae]|uniref:Squalene-associated FAD-dependent desaturase n=1 Tax=Allobranchiibius huperziae TaxID=1874116 RepID=A0A853DCQ6_9MICO|nr:hydroxysqualene dehydroxylase HpnE [Allobranchiibius huperziae]NYJ73783.1 squalene-associated FAD-dependent desaturase [Allobranchiibius huperziae]
MTRAAVIGGGLAGITAAIGLADAGCDVTLLERQAHLGGLTHSFERDGMWVDNGQHVFLRCCTAYRSLLQRLAVAHLVTMQDRLDIPMRSGRRATTGHLRRNGLPAPMHLAGSLARHPWLPVPDRVRAGRIALALAAVDTASAASDETSFGDWLDAHHCSRRLRENLWDVVGLATLNVHADECSLALAATVFQLGLLTDRTAGDIGWSDVPLSQLHGDAAVRALGAAGAEVRVRAKVERVTPASGRWVVRADGVDTEYDQAVLAVPPDVTERLAPWADLGAGPGYAARLGSSPIVNLHVLLDRVVLDTPFVVALDSPLQWVFDRTGQSGVRRGQYLAVSLSGADEDLPRTAAQLREIYLPELRRLLPMMDSAHVLDFFVTREPRATFRATPGTAAYRPTQRTGHVGLAVAGAWTATGWPATMEGAVRSGRDAAAALLQETRRSPRDEVAA